MDHVAIKCSGIKKAYGSRSNRVEALKGIDLEVYDQSLTLLVGPSGSGKSTLLSIITTILTPDEGELILLDQPMNHLKGNEKAHFTSKNLGIVFQSLFLIPTLTVLENVSLPLLIRGDDSKNGIKKAQQVLDQMQISHKADISPALLSKGQQQRVAIARAVVNDSKIIVCDEPTSALDQESGLEIMAILHDLATKFSKTVLVVTHDQRTFPFADRIVYMSDGKIIDR